MADGDLHSPAPGACLDFPEAFVELFQPWRFKVYYGGRGGAKSWNFARALLIQGTQRSLRILCAREIQKSMRDSVHKLLVDQIAAMGLEGAYEVQADVIRSRINKTEFIFAGLKHNINSIKSKEGIDIVWVEEADETSKESWEALIPTIRKEGSEIWISFNPSLAANYTYQHFVLKPPKSAFVKKVGWRDNHWFPKVLNEERLEMKERDYDQYLVTWEGFCKTSLEGAVYAAELREAQAAHRITKVHFEPSIPVDTYWDLGWGDATAIWFVQKVGLEYHILRYLQARQKKIPWFMDQLAHMKFTDRSGVERTPQWGKDWLPHDAKRNQQGTGMTVQEDMRSPKYRRNVQITPNIRVDQGINAARSLFPHIWWDEEGTQQGMELLRLYRYDIDSKTNLWTRHPVHDESSHPADAFRYIAVANRIPPRNNKRVTIIGR